MDIYTPCYVYWIRRSTHTDIKTEGYIGISKNPEKRWRGHRSKGNNTNLGKALKKYDDIVYEIVEKLDGVDEAKVMERSLRPDIYIGWNIVTGGGGGVMTEETKKKLSIAHKGKTKTAEHCKALSEANMGHTPWNKGMTFSEEYILRIGIGKWNKGRVHSEESRRNMSVGQQKRGPRSEETKKKTSESLLGQRCKPILVDGVEYPSRKAAIEVHGRSIIRMIRNGTAKYL
jgi:predicted GIY-YIG superfamily endonuclease